MGVFSAYDSTDPNIVDEIDAAADNELVIANQFRHYSYMGVEFSDPEWQLAPLAPLLSEMTEERDFGDSYDYMPDKLSMDLYGTHELWPVLLYINLKFDRASFKGPTLKTIGLQYSNQLLEMLRFGKKRAAAFDEDGIPNITDLTIKQVYIS